ncbi:DUF4145 domain-containing protein [Rhizobium leguminosarum]|nr:DUF4145 domain-containing protein [Rhizobium leguminosarum]
MGEGEVDRGLWRKSYGSIPRFPCPRCGTGKLVRKGDIVHHEPRHTTLRLEEEGWAGNLSEGRFVCMLLCNRTFCGEVVTVAGTYSSHEHFVPVGEDDDHEAVTDYSYIPYSIRPAPLMIEEPKGLNAEVRTHLRKAYDLFWTDLASCANRLRIVVEYLLDQLGVPQEAVKGNRKSVRLDLAERASLLAVARPGHEKTLTALRYVGNAGSHEAKGEFEDIMDCFDLLEDVLKELIDRRSEKLEEKADRIIASKGRPKPQTGEADGK